MIVSLIWLRINNALVGGASFPLANINSLAQENLQEFQQLCLVHAKIPATTCLVRWRPPSFGQLKINFDGTIFDGDNTAGLGVIICNENELVSYDGYFITKNSIAYLGRDGGNASSAVCSLVCSKVEFRESDSYRGFKDRH